MTNAGKDRMLWGEIVKSMNSINTSTIRRE